MGEENRIRRNGELSLKDAGQRVNRSGRKRKTGTSLLNLCFCLTHPRSGPRPGFPLYLNLSSTSSHGNFRKEEEKVRGWIEWLRGGCGLIDAVLRTGMAPKAPVRGGMANEEYKNVC